MSRARIIGTGSYVGETVVTNKDLESRFNTSDEWIRAHLGIQERRIAKDSQVTSDLGAEAAEKALEMAGIRAKDVDLIIMATCSPDHLFPGSGLMVQKKIGAGRAGVFDMKAQCSGFIYLSTVGSQMVLGDFKNVLVVASELIIRMMDPKDRISNCLFADGASAMVLRKESKETGKGILSYHLGSNPNFYYNAYTPSGGSACPLNQLEVGAGNNFIKYSLSTGGDKPVDDISSIMEAKSFEWMYIKHCLKDSIKISLDKIGKTTADMDFFLPHPGNMNNYHALLKEMNYPANKSHVVLEKYGNSSAPQIGIALDEAIREGKIQSGDLVGMTAIGMGMQFGSLTFRW